jgi:hypothetical protein
METKQEGIRTSEYTLTTGLNLQEQNIHLPLRQHHEPLHRQAERLSQQAGRQVRYPLQALSRLRPTGLNVAPRLSTPNNELIGFSLFRGKPKSLFAQASAKRLEAEGSGNGNNGGALFGSKPAPAAGQDNPFGTN